MQSKLRIGLAEPTLLAALAHAAVYSEKHSTPAKVANSLEDVSCHALEYSLTIYLYVHRTLYLLASRILFYLYIL